MKTASAWECLLFYSVQQNVLRRRGEDIRTGIAQAKGRPVTLPLPAHLYGQWAQPWGTCPGE